MFPDDEVASIKTTSKLSSALFGGDESEPLYLKLIV